MVDFSSLHPQKACPDPPDHWHEAPYGTAEHWHERDAWRERNGFDSWFRITCCTSHASDKEAAIAHVAEFIQNPSDVQGEVLRAHGLAIKLTALGDSDSFADPQYR